MKVETLAEASQALRMQGYFLSSLSLPAEIRESVVRRDWEALDRQIRTETLPGGLIFQELSRYVEFSEIEFILSIRSSREYPDEDGIWHDDGSRVLAFSLSLTLNSQSIEGGRLQIRRREGARGAEEGGCAEIPTPPFGTLIVFSTGHGGFEHKINRVIQGERIIIAGWCT